jgi:Fe2+ transport system protein FeoA
MAQHLSNINNGETVIVRQIEESSLKVKLMEMGIVGGKELRVLYRAPLGDPMAIDVAGYVLSLRNDEANMITVDLKSNQL